MRLASPLGRPKAGGRKKHPALSQRQWIETTLTPEKGSRVLCKACRYEGAADVIKSTGLGSGLLERCPKCKSLNLVTMENAMKNESWLVDEWQGCYPSNWKGLIVAEAMSHPAKFSSRLIHKIYEHMKEEDWIRTGDEVLDPFGGVALGALEAMQRGLRWRGIELEAKFVDLGIRNIESWNRRFGTMPKWNGDARLVQGDSRKLLKVLASSIPHTAVMKSPPYADSLNSKAAGIDWEKAGRPDRLFTKSVGIQGANGREENYGITDGNLGSMQADDFDVALGSPPYADSDQNYKGGWSRFHKNHEPLFENDSQRPADYGKSEGQLSEMNDDGFDVALSSPPFEQRSADGGWQMLGKYAEEGKLTVKQVKGNGHKSYPSWDKERNTSYGESDGQMSKMQSGDFDIALSSPPFLQATGGTPEPKPGGVIDEKLYKRHAAGNAGAHGYGKADGQLSAMGSDGFEAAVSSPPYNLPMSQEHNGSRGGSRGTTPSEDGAFVKYGNTEGQLEGMASSEGDFTAAMKSPPYESDVVRERYSEKDLERFKSKNLSGSNGGFTGGILAQEKYGDTDGNLGNDTSDSFWLAARAIVDQVYIALKPGGKAVWVLKGYVKNKAYVDFPDQWRRLCEAAGFVTLHEHHAMLVHNKGVSHTLEGGTVEHKTESKSFFRRLAEKKGSPKIDFETVFCMEKPA